MLLLDLLRPQRTQTTAAAGAVRDDPPVPESASTPTAAVHTPQPISTAPAPRPSFGSIDVGVCYHRVHVDLDDGERYGVTACKPKPGGPFEMALLIRCRFSNRDGH